MRARNLAISALLIVAPAASASANVVTDWDEQGILFIQGNAPAPPRIGPTGGLRIITMMHLAMFQAINAIDPHYETYKAISKPDPGCSQDAAAASAAAKVLVTMHPESAAKTKEALNAYLSKISDGEAKDRGIRLGEEMAVKVMELRAHDGNDTPNSYRPITQPGVYTGTQVTVSWENVTMAPFVMKSPDQFRPPPPVALTSERWAKDYNEIKGVGAKNSTTRTPKQTEDARFWLTVPPASNNPLARQIVIAKNMSPLESARFMAVVDMAQMDAAIAVFDAKYHYNFWRPITAIRNGDIDGNPATERDATWQPIDITPAHPEYPCAHCIITGAMTGAIQAMLGSDEIPEVVLTSPTAPGVTHKFTSLHAFNDEVSEARIAAGFHWRFSTEVGKDMGWKIGAYTVEHCMQPLTVAAK